MKTFRCPWCGERCISSLNKSFFYDRGRLKCGNRCPSCNKRFIPKEGLRFVLIPEILVFLLLFLLGVKYGDGYYLLCLAYLLSLVFIIEPLIRYFFRPIMRCADEGYRPLPVATPYVVALSAPVRLVQEDIYAVLPTRDQRPIVVHTDMQDTFIPVHLQTDVVAGRYRMGFLKPETIHTDLVEVGTVFQISVAEGQTVTATVIAK